MPKKFLLSILLILLSFLVSGCFEMELKEGYTDEEMLTYLRDKYGIEFQIIDYKQEIKYAKEESYDYYYKTWTVRPRERPDLTFNVINDLNTSGKKLVLKDEYPQRLFYYYLEQSDIHYRIENLRKDEDIDSIVYIYFKSKEDIRPCVKATCDVIKKAAEDSSYQYKASEDREIAGGLVFTFEDPDIEYQISDYFRSHRLVLKKDTVVDTNTKYEISYGNYDGRFAPYDEEEYNKPMNLDEIPKVWEQFVSDDYDRYYHDKPYIDEARTVALKELEEKGYVMKSLDCSGVWNTDGLWNENTILFNGRKADDSYIALDLEYVNDKWRVKIRYEE